MASQQISVLLQQLEMAHNRNDLIDNLRYSVVKIYFSFQALFLGASVFKYSELSQLSIQLGIYFFIIPITIGVIGCSLCMLYISWHFYIYRAKGWIISLEKLLGEYFTEERIDLNKAMYYKQNHAAETRYEWVFFSTVSSMIVSNILIILLLTIIAGKKEPDFIFSLILSISFIYMSLSYLAYIFHTRKYTDECKKYEIATDRS